jgi:hypothetical protein
MIGIYLFNYLWHLSAGKRRSNAALRLFRATATAVAATVAVAMLADATLPATAAVLAAPLVGLVTAHTAWNATATPRSAAALLGSFSLALLLTMTAFDTTLNTAFTSRYLASSAIIGALTLPASILSTDKFGSPAVAKVRGVFDYVIVSCVSDYFKLPNALQDTAPLTRIRHSKKGEIKMVIPDVARDATAIVRSVMATGITTATISAFMAGKRLTTRNAKLDSPKVLEKVQKAITIAGTGSLRIDFVAPSHAPNPDPEHPTAAKNPTAKANSATDMQATSKAPLTTRDDPPADNKSLQPHQQQRGGRAKPRGQRYEERHSDGERDGDDSRRPRTDRHANNTTMTASSSGTNIHNVGGTINIMYGGNGRTPQQHRNGENDTGKAKSTGQQRKHDKPDTPGDTGDRPKPKGNDKPGNQQRPHPPQMPTPPPSGKSDQAAKEKGKQKKDETPKDDNRVASITPAGTLSITGELSASNVLVKAARAVLPGAHIFNPSGKGNLCACNAITLATFGYQSKRFSRMLFQFAQLAIRELIKTKKTTDTVAAIGTVFGSGSYAVTKDDVLDMAYTPDTGNADLSIIAVLSIVFDVCIDIYRVKHVKTTEGERTTTETSVELAATANRLADKKRKINLLINMSTGNAHYYFIMTEAAHKRFMEGKRRLPIGDSSASLADLHKHSAADYAIPTELGDSPDKIADHTDPKTTAMQIAAAFSRLRTSESMQIADAFQKQKTGKGLVRLESRGRKAAKPDDEDDATDDTTDDGNDGSGDDEDHGGPSDSDDDEDDLERLRRELHANDPVGSVNFSDDSQTPSSSGQRPPARRAAVRSAAATRTQPQRAAKGAKDNATSFPSSTTILSDTQTSSGSPPAAATATGGAAPPARA